MAVRIGYLSKNPSGNCILPRIEQAEIHPLDTPELSKLLAFLKGHEHDALIVTAIFTGLRSGELLGLTWDSVDFENGLIRVTKQLAQPRKKGEVFRFATPKNSKPRTIAPAPTVFQVLKKHKEEQEAQRKALGGRHGTMVASPTWCSRIRMAATCPSRPHGRFFTRSWWQRVSTRTASTI